MARTQFSYDQYKGAANVKDFGAVGDGSTNDRVAIQAAIDSLTSGVVRFPASSGAYKVDGGSLTMKSNVTIHIEKGATVERETNATTYNLFNCEGLSNIGFTGDGTIKGDRTTHTGGANTSILIRVVNCDDVVIKGLTIYDSWGDGVYIGRDPDGKSNRVKITDCTIYDNKRNNISVVHCQDFTITGNICYKNAITSDAPDTLIDIESGGSEYAEYGSVSDNVMWGSTNAVVVFSTKAVGGSTPSASRYTLIDANVIRDVTGIGVAVSNGSGCVVSNNLIEDIDQTSGTYGNGIVVQVTQWSNPTSDGVIVGAVVSGNIVRGCESHGIFLDARASTLYGDMSDVNITGNVSIENAGSGLWIEGNSNTAIDSINITGNTFSKNTGNGIYWVSNVPTDYGSYNVVGNVIAENGGRGIYALYGYNSLISNNLITLNGLHGIEMFRVDDSSVLSNMITFNSATTDNTSYAIYLNESDDVSVRSNTVRQGTGNNHNTAIFLTASNTTGARIFGNDLRDSAQTATINTNSNTDVVIRQNDGYVTENYGTSSAIASGATIAHGLATTPTYISLTAQSTGPSDVYATADGTNITVTYTGGGTEVFYWEAKV